MSKQLKTLADFDQEALRLKEAGFFEGDATQMGERQLKKAVKDALEAEDAARNGRELPKKEEQKETGDGTYCDSEGKVWKFKDGMHKSIEDGRVFLGKINRPIRLEDINRPAVMDLLIANRWPGLELVKE